jgi:hypothetical protein
VKFAAGVTAIEVNLGKDVTIGVVDTGGKFSVGINNTGIVLVNLPPVALVPVVN